MIKVRVPDAIVHANVIPPERAHEFFKDTDLWFDPLANAGKKKFPQFGAFEVYHKGALIFSKVESKCWPNPVIVAGRVAGDESAFAKPRMRRSRTATRKPLRSRLDVSPSATHQAESMRTFRKRPLDVKRESGMASTTPNMPNVIIEPEEVAKKVEVPVDVPVKNPDPVDGPQTTPEAHVETAVPVEPVVVQLPKEVKIVEESAPEVTNQIVEQPAAAQVVEAPKVSAKPQAEEAKESNPADAPKLVLHFDINKTIVMSDGVQNLSSEQVFNKIIACQAWGSVVENEWKVGHETLTTKPPSEGLGTYFNYIKDSIPLQGKEEEPDNDKRNEYNKGQRGKRQKFLATFTNEGNPGTQFTKELEEMTKALVLPEYVMNELNSEENKEEAEALIKLYEGASFYLVPSFFKVLNHLRNQKVDFDIVFRTFGTDIIDLSKEYNRFCEGRHPMFNGRNGTVFVKMDGSEGGKDYRENRSFTGYLKRASDSPEETVMVLGSLDKAPAGTSEEEFHASGISEGKISVTRSIAAIYAKIMQCLAARGCVSLQDDFNAWNSNAEKAEFGKPVFIDTANPSIHHIFFDDNAYDEPTSIVDVRDLATGKPMPIARAWNKYVVNVDTYRAITDTDYFIKSINVCLQNFAAELAGQTAEISAEIKDIASEQQAEAPAVPAKPEESPSNDEQKPVEVPAEAPALPAQPEESVSNAEQKPVEVPAEAPALPAQPEESVSNAVQKPVEVPAEAPELPAQPEESVSNAEQNPVEVPAEAPAVPAQPEESVSNAEQTPAEVPAEVPVVPAQPEESVSNAEQKPVEIPAEALALREQPEESVSNAEQKPVEVPQASHEAQPEANKTNEVVADQPPSDPQQPNEATDAPNEQPAEAKEEDTNTESKL